MDAYRPNTTPGARPNARAAESDVHHPWDAPPAWGTPVPVADGVYWLRMPLPFALDHINLWLLRDTRGWTLVDTGVARDEVRALWRSLLRGPMAAGPLERVVVTHFHPDHFGLAGWLAEATGAELWMSRAEWLTGSLLQADAEARHAAAQAALFRAHGLDGERLQALRERGNAYRRLVSVPPPRFMRLREGDGLRVRGRRWEVRMARGHAPEHACLYCPDLGVLIAGDQVLPRITPNVSLPASEPDSDPLALFLESLGAMRVLPPRTLVLPSHGLPFRGLHARIGQIERHHRERLDALASACARPRSAAELVEVLFRRRLDTHQLMFAMGETLAHLRYLEVRGALVRETGTGAVVRFGQAGRDPCPR